MTQPSFAAIGECMLEFACVQGRQYQLGYAGDTLNVATYFARSCDPEVTVEYITALGDDPFSDEMIAGWADEHIGANYVQRLAGVLPGLYLIETDVAGERSFHYYRSQAAAKRMFQGEPGEQLSQQLAQFGMIFLSGITLAILDPQSRDVLLQGLQSAREQGALVCFDGNYRARLWSSVEEAWSVFEQFLSEVDIALPSCDDEHELFADESMIATIERMHGYGVTEVVVKQGEQGCVISNQAEHKQLQLPIPEVKQVVDTTAAGDSFDGAYLARRFAGDEIKHAAEYAMRVAGTVIGQKGAIIAKELMPNR